MASQALQANSENAQDLAAATLKFKQYLQESSTEITSIVSELFAISAGLQELDTATKDPRNARRSADYREDQRVVLVCLEYTFKDMHRLYGKLGSPRFRSYKEAYYHVWDDTLIYFEEESHNTLLERLEYFKNIINDLTAIVAGMRYFTEETEDTLQSFERLLDVQEDKLADDLNNLQISAPRPQRSWERRRPLHDLKPPAAHGGRSRSRSRNRPRSRSRDRRPAPHHSPTSPFLHSPLFGASSYPFPPEAPIIPPSPSTTTATTSTASSDPRPSFDHWLPIAFGQNRPTTTFKITGSESACYGENQSGASGKLKIDHEELLMLPFDGYMEMRLYLRPRDRRARVWCRMERGGRRTQSVQNVTSLQMLRKESCLQLCKMDSRKRLVLWANLRFASYERLVLFHCAFLALKAQDEANPVKDLDDHIMDGEIPVFSGKILDDNYEHALQVFKDVNSGGIRLMASARKGPLKRCPIWVAFITYKVQAREWIYKAEPRKIHLMELTRYVFSHNYQPHFGPHGEHELHFKDPKDTDAFFRVIDDLGEKKI